MDELDPTRKNYLQGLTSLPDNRWVYRHPKVVETPTEQLHHRVTPDTFIPPPTAVQAGQMAVEESIKHGYPTPPTS